MTKVQFYRQLLYRATAVSVMIAINVIIKFSTVILYDDEFSV